MSLLEFLATVIGGWLVLWMAWGALVAGLAGKKRKR
jgi:hypothetical protein